MKTRTLEGVGEERERERERERGGLLVVEHVINFSLFTVKRLREPKFERRPFWIW